jgi:hypothetical protein
MKVEDAVNLSVGNSVRAIGDLNGRDNITGGKKYDLVCAPLYRYGLTESTTLLPDGELNEVLFPISNDKSKLVYLSHRFFEIVS